MTGSRVSRLAIDPGAARVGFVVVLLLGLVVARAAQAQQAQRRRLYIVAVSPDPELDAVAARAGSIARAMLRDQQGIDWQEPDEQFLGYDDTALAKLREARQRLADGRQAYLNLELDHAVQLLQGAVDDFNLAAAALEDPGDLGDALLLLGAAQVAAGNTRDARATFERLHVQMPDRAPDPQQFNPEVVRRYKQAAPRDASNPSSTIEIESAPPGAVAYVDFVARGRTPIRVGHLLGGRHIVRVTRPGSAPYVQTVDLRRRQTTQVSATLHQRGAAGLADMLGNIASSDIGAMQTGGPIAKVANALSLDQIGVIRVSHASTGDAVHIKMSMFDVASSSPLLDSESDASRDPHAFDAAIRQLVSRALAAGLHPPEGNASEAIVAHPRLLNRGPTRRATSPSLLSRWWFWTALGVVAIGTAAVIFFATRGNGLGQDTGGQVVLEF